MYICIYVWQRVVSDMTISLQSNDSSEWILKYFSSGRRRHLLKTKKKDAGMFDLFLKNLIFAPCPVKSSVLFPVQWSDPFWISGIEFHRENYFDSASI